LETTNQGEQLMGWRSEEFFSSIQEEITDRMEMMSEKERNALLIELETDTDNTVLTFDLFEIVENI
tara:strand:+ start:269 stop:466 length:198 start_codon:yes stop_codon:yes gene_type:complete